MDNNELLDIDAPSGWGNTGEHSYIQRGRKATGAALVELANADGVIGDSNPLAVKVTGVVSLNSNAVALTVTDYIAVTNRAPDYAIDDSITVTRFYDTSTDPPTISSVNWYNNDESAQISTPPNMAHLQYSGEKALTLTQLQSLSLATEAKQDDLNALVGEAQENPTNPYSLLGSIKRLIAAVKTEIVLAAGNALIGTVSLNEKTVSGTITAQDETVDIDLTGFSNLSCQVTGTYAASALTLRLSNDNQNWTTSTALDTFSSQGAVSSSTITAGTTGLFNCSINGAKHARIIALGAITGTASIVLNAKNAKSPSSYIANITTLAGFTPFGTASSAVATAVDTSNTFMSYFKAFAAAWLPLNSISGSGSGTITTGGTAQNALNSDANGYRYLIQNNSSGDLWFSTLTTAVQSQPSVRLAPKGTVGDTFITPSIMKTTGALSVIGATTGQEYTVRKW